MPSHQSTLATRSLASYSFTRGQVLLNVLDNVAGRAEAWRRDAAGQWVKKDIAAPYPGTLLVRGLHDPLVKDDALAEAFTATYVDFLTPDTLSLGHTGTDTLLRRLIFLSWNNKASKLMTLLPL